MERNVLHVRRLIIVLTIQLASFANAGMLFMTMVRPTSCVSHATIPAPLAQQVQLTACRAQAQPHIVNSS